MNVSMMRDIGAYILAVFADFVPNIVAAAGGDNTESSGVYIDRQDYNSAKVVITYEAVLGEDETLSVAANVQDASDSSGTGVADYGDALANAVVATGGSGGSTEQGTVVLDVNLDEAKQFIRTQFTPDLSAANTDTAEISVTVILGGAVEIPAA
jgi:hypothetical protein